MKQDTPHAYWYTYIHLEQHNVERTASPGLSRIHGNLCCLL